MSDGSLKLIVPPCTVRFFEEGEHCEDLREGDFILVRHATVFADVIARGLELEAKLHRELEGFTWLDHGAFTRNDDNGVPMISEMGPHGYERRLPTDYRPLLYARVRFDVSAEKIATAVSYDKACERVEYGWGKYVPLILDGIDNGKFVSSWGDSLFCTEHTTLVAMGLGLFPDRPAAAVNPARFALWTGARHA